MNGQIDIKIVLIALDTNLLYDEEECREMLIGFGMLTGQTR